MATSAEHKRRAEELIADVTFDDGSVGFGDGGEAYVAVALVHAILATIPDVEDAKPMPTCAPAGYRYVEGVDEPWVLERIIYDTHAAAYTETGRDTGHALCGGAEGPVSVDSDDVDCGACMVALEQGPEVAR